MMAGSCKHPLRPVDFMGEGADGLVNAPEFGGAPLAAPSANEIEAIGSFEFIDSGSSAMKGGV